MSSGIFFFNSDDFTLRETAKGKLLALEGQSKGLNLILFYSKECQFCDKFLAQFKQLPNLILGCKFAMVNINQNKEIVNMSKNTLAPITYVPDVILYVNGLPYIRYDGPSEMQHIKDFIVDIYQKLQKTSFLQEQQNMSQSGENADHSQKLSDGKSIGFANQGETSQNDIPEYTIGKPLSGSSKDVYGKCYLNFDSAYVSSR
jgi:thiol-disulfide isomerase/thioredoxin